MAVTDKKRRLFFALWPSVQVRESIVETVNPLLHEIAGRTILPKNLHITLHYIGSVNDDKKDCLHEAAQSIIADPFELSLDRFGHFSKAKIFWMAVQKLPPELSRLHQNLGKALSVCDFHSDHRPYSPHVSLLRNYKGRSIDYPEFSIKWHVDEFVLVESCSAADGVNYKVIERYLMQDK
ncbi:MAG: RNA 2',3'-cyclic phosphodiesterase [Gammaproteobacteria bacterium]|nr:RNA 2',3'-cyclic phosphodiesterase [Gammaproteobacteria bacterium]